MSEVPEPPHKPADDTEQVYFEGSPLLRGHIGTLLLWILIAVVLGVGVPVIASVAGHPLPGLVIFVLIVIAMGIVLIPVVWTKTIRYRITNYRIDLEHGLLSKKIETLELWHVEDISLYQSAVNRILGVGVITVISRDDTNPQLKLEGLPQPRPLFESMKQRIIAVKRQRGVIKMDMGN